MSCSSSKSKRKAKGCMAVFIHLFHFQPFNNFPSHRNLTTYSPPRPKATTKGLKVIEESPPSATTTSKDKKSLNIPISMRVRTERALMTTSSCNSPGCETPNLVARLMGLDLLPERPHYGSCRLTTSHTLSNKGTRLGTRSLPGSPRISSARKSDFDIHRLSLQDTKENNKHHQEFGCSRQKLMKQDQESPRDYSRHIVKERVFGMDITNSVVKNREVSQNRRRDSTVSCSSRTKFTDKEKKPRPIHKPNSSHSFRQEQITQKPKRVKQRAIKKCKKSESETRRPCQTPDAFLSESNRSNRKRSTRINPNDLHDNDSRVFSGTMVDKPGPLALRCNRWMLFDQVNETVKRRREYSHNRCSDIGEIDLREAGCLLETKKLEEEVIIAEIERGIVDTLLHETTSVLRTQSV